MKSLCGPQVTNRLCKFCKGKRWEKHLSQRDKSNTLPISRSSENKVLIYKWTGQNNLAEVAGFQQKVTAWDVELEKRQQAPRLEESPGEVAGRGLLRGTLPHQPDLDIGQILKHQFETKHKILSFIPAALCQTDLEVIL